MAEGILRSDALLDGNFEILHDAGRTKIVKEGQGDLGLIHDTIATFKGTTRKTLISAAEHIKIWPQGEYMTTSLQDAISARKVTYAQLRSYRSSLNLLCDTVNFIDCELADGTALSASWMTYYDLFYAVKTTFSAFNCGPTIGKLVLTNMTIEGNNTLYVKNECYLNNIDGAGTLTIRRRSFDQDTLKIHLSDTDLERLRFPDDLVELIVDTNSRVNPYRTQLSMYKQLLSRYADDSEEKQKFDIQLKKLTYRHQGAWFKSWLRENWDNFGYDKDRIFKNALFLMLVCFGINLFLYPRLLKQAYMVAEFEKAEWNIHTRYKNPWLSAIYSNIYCFLYTALIFWGIKLNLEQLKLDKLALSLWIILQYLAGIICLAYIANIIITRA